MEAETARVTLFDGGDIMYGNNVKLTAQRVWTGLTVYVGGMAGEGGRMAVAEEWWMAGGRDERGGCLAVDVE